MSSIRGQLTRGLAVGLALIFVMCGTILYAGVRFAFTRQFNETLLAKARAFAALSNRTHDDIDGRRVPLAMLPPAAIEAIEREAGNALVTEVEEVVDAGRVFYKVECIRDGVESEFLVTASGEYRGPVDEYGFAIHDAGMPEFQSKATPEYYQVCDEDGEVIAKSPSLEGTSLPKLHVHDSAPAYVDITLPDGRSGRMVILGFRPPFAATGDLAGAEDLVLTMARSRSELDAVLRIFLFGLFATGILLAAGAALVVRATVQRGLAPLGLLALQAAVIDAGSLNARFPTERLPEELAPISARLNELLERLESAFNRERRFTADVAHELRTPIAELRTLTEVGLHAAESQGLEGERSRYLHDAHAIALQIERLVAALLTLVRCGSSQQVVNREHVDLVAIVNEAWRPLAEKAAERSLQVAFATPEEAVVESDQTLLLAIMTNVLSNAVSYTPAGGDVSVDVVNEERAFAVCVSNTTDQLEPADVPHLTEPFWRKDEARSGTSHSGVGLSVVAAFAELLGLKLAFTLPSPNRFMVTLSNLRVL